MTFNQHTSRLFGSTGGTAGFDFEQVLNDVFGGSNASPTTVKTTATTGLIKHTVTVPGYGAEDIDVSVEGARVLVVRTKPAKEGERAQVLARVHLIEGADYAKAKASVKNGLLTVAVPYSAVPVENFSLEVTAE